MNPLTIHQERKTRKDRGTRRGHHFASYSSAFNQPPFSHLNDDDDGNGEGTSRASTHSPIRFINCNAPLRKEDCSLYWNCILISEFSATSSFCNMKVCEYHVAKRWSYSKVCTEATIGHRNLPGCLLQSL
nr:hypothetical protein [Tanacetum cinerariifolium]